LIDEGVAVVHGHSSHHVKAIEVFKGRLILYGCGDFLTDYEGISGYEMFRGDLGLMYLVDLGLRNGQLVSADWSRCKCGVSSWNTRRPPIRNGFPLCSTG